MAGFRPCHLFLLSLVVLFFGSCAGIGFVQAASLPSLQKNLKKEQVKAKERRSSLDRLTEEERTLHASLAAAEARVLELEQGIADYQQKLQGLVSSDEAERLEYERLLQEMATVEESQADVLALLWEITARRLSVGGREMADWASVDREFTWSKQLLDLLGEYRKTLDEQESALVAVLGRREKISSEVAVHMALVKKEKTMLLQQRLAYEQRLAALRKKKRSSEEELEATLKVISDLNLQIEEHSGLFQHSKGALPWPAKGKVAHRFSNKASSPFRGISLATQAGEEVKAISLGTVVHNDVLRGFGTVLILQHGEDYYSLYAYLDKSDCLVGEQVRRGAVLGYAGFNTQVSGPGIYFELRFRQKAINPEEWLGPR